MITATVTMPIDFSKVAITNNDANQAKIFGHAEGTANRNRLPERLSPQLRSWIDEVILPILLQEFVQ